MAETTDQMWSTFFMSVGGSTSTLPDDPTDPTPVDPDPNPDPNPDPTPLTVNPPTGVQLEWGDRQVKVFWTASDTPSVASHGVYRGTARVFDMPMPTCEYVITGLTNGTSYTIAVDAQLNGIRSAKTAYITGQPKAPPVVEPDPDPQPEPPVEAFSPLVSTVNVNRFGTSGRKRDLMGALDRFLNATDNTLASIRQAPKSWDADDPYPTTLIINGSKKPFGANPIQRGAGCGQGLVLYFGGLISKDPRFVDRQYRHLKAALDLLYRKGGVGTKTTDAWLGWRYGTNGANDFTVNTGEYTALEASLNGGFAAHAHSLWVNRDTPSPAGITKAQKLAEVNRFRCFYRLHHLARWKAKNGAPTEAKPAPTGRNFAHSDMMEALTAEKIASIETDMYKLNMRSTLSIDMPDGFDNQSLDLHSSTTADRTTHSDWKIANWIIRRWALSTTRLRTAKGTDIRDANLRALYGVTGCTYWDQRTDQAGFTANSGYNQMTWGGLVALYLDGLITYSLGTKAKADAFMKSCAGGTSVGCLPERLRGKGKTAYVFDDPSSTTSSLAYLLNGINKRAFGGSTSGYETDDAQEWDNELYGILAAFDPPNRIATITQELRSYSGSSSAKAGGVVSMLFNEVWRDTYPNFT